MTRKICAAAVALLVALGFLAAVATPAVSAAPAAPRSGVAQFGDYQGTDHANNAVTFTYRDNQIVGFKVGGRHFGNATLGHGAYWERTCYQSYCFQGHWQTSTTVVGAWWDPHGNEHAWSATYKMAVLPYEGTYMGSDHGQRTIHFSFSGNYLSSFRVSHHTIGGAHVSGGAFHETCHNGYCIKGHWQDDYRVVGYWRTPDGHWTAWEVRAYSA